MDEKLYGGLTLTEVAESFESLLVRDLAQDLLTERKIVGMLEGLEEGQRVESPEEELAFSYEGQVAGIDEQGTYQVGMDGHRHDAAPSYVLEVAALRVKELEEQVRELGEDAKYHLGREQEAGGPGKVSFSFQSGKLGIRFTGLGGHGEALDLTEEETEALYKFLTHARRVREQAKLRAEALARGEVSVYVQRYVDETGEPRYLTGDEIDPSKLDENGMVSFTVTTQPPKV